MKSKKLKTFIFFSTILILFSILFLGQKPSFSFQETAKSTGTHLLKGPLMGIKKIAGIQEKVVTPNKPKYVRGIHISPWLASSKRGRKRINQLLAETELNTLVICIKEIQGEVYISGVEKAHELNTYVRVLPGIQTWLDELKANGIYTVARIVVFKDDLLARIQPEWAVKHSSGGPWQDYSKMAWLDPFVKENWKYTIDIAKRAVKLGFEEIQYDYIRFPSDGSIRHCRYAQAFSSNTAVAILVDFLAQSYKQLKPMGANLSIDVFGLTTTDKHDLGIGQKLIEMTEQVDYVSPMVYPSHYQDGAYGLKNPDASPYKTVYFSIKGGKRRLGDDYIKLRPYLQDFSLGHIYETKEVRDQIQACYDNDVAEWILWDPRCQYTREALKGPDFSDIYEKSNRPDPTIICKSTATAKIEISTTTFSISPSTTTINKSSFTVENKIP